MSEHKLITDIRKTLKNTNLCDDVIEYIIPFVCPSKFRYVEFKINIERPPSMYQPFTVMFDIIIRYCPNCKCYYYNEIADDLPKESTNDHLLRCGHMYQSGTYYEFYSLLTGYGGVFNTLNYVYQGESIRYSVQPRKSIQMKDQDGNVIQC